MKLSLKNIGKIGTASVEINGITVIAGENNTGKSTVGRALFAVFNSFYNIDKQIQRERIRSVENLIDFVHRITLSNATFAVDVNEISKYIVSHIEQFKNNSAKLKTEIIRLFLQYDENFEKKLEMIKLDEVICRIMDVLNVSDMELFQSVLEKKLEAEFNGQISNVFSDENGEIRLQIKEKDLRITIEKDHVTHIQNSLGLHTEAIYIDDPFVLDEMQASSYRSFYGYVNHRSHLRRKLLFQQEDSNLVDEIVVNNKLDRIYSKITSVCSGDVVKNSRSGFGYRKSGSDKVLDVRNLSTGLKTFVILKMLLQNGVLEYNGTIILDEPEIHLHPEWQLLFAELIVLIHKEFGMHILLNTHSPYFLNAIEVYAAKYGVDDTCKYYLTRIENDSCSLDDVTNHVEAIYSKLARPLQKTGDKKR